MQVLEAFQEFVPSVLSPWHGCARLLRKELWNMEQYTDDIWCMNGAPKVILRFSKLKKYPYGMDVRQKQYSDWEYIPNSTPIERQLEWIPTDLVRVEEYKAI